MPGSLDFPGLQLFVFHKVRDSSPKFPANQPCGKTGFRIVCDASVCSLNKSKELKNGKKVKVGTYAAGDLCCMLPSHKKCVQNLYDNGEDGSGDDDDADRWDSR